MLFNIRVIIGSDGIQKIKGKYHKKRVFYETNKRYSDKTNSHKHGPSKVMKSEKERRRGLSSNSKNFVSGKKMHRKKHKMTYNNSHTHKYKRKRSEDALNRFMKHNLNGRKGKYGKEDGKKYEKRKGYSSVEIISRPQKRKPYSDHKKEPVDDGYNVVHVGARDSKFIKKLNKKGGKGECYFKFGAKENKQREKLSLLHNIKMGKYRERKSDKDSKTMTTMTLFSSNPMTTEDHQSSAKQVSKDLTKRLAELFTRLEEEEGDSPDVKKLKLSIKDAFQKSPPDFKTTLYFYKILKLLGKGSFGKVYMSSQILTNRVVAIKCLEKRLVREEDRKNKIMHELLMFKTLSGHPDIISIYEVFENKKYYFFVMEYASGGDLLQKMKKEGRLEENTAKSIFVQLLRGLKHIHSKNILHRDIKLDNVLLSEREDAINAKICDFGVSRFIKEGEVINEQCGTPAYIAPEIIKKKGYTGFKADIWSLGVLLYAMVLGSMPFKANSLELLHKKILARECEMEDDSASKEVLELIDRMLQVDPSNRISLKQIIEHSWLRDDPKLATINNLRNDVINNPEEFVIQKLLRFNFPLDFIHSSLKDITLNHAFACYLALAKDFI